MKFVLAVVLAVTEGASTPSSSPSPAPAAAARATTVEVLRLRSSGLDGDVLTRELGLRVPHARVVIHDAAPPIPGFMVFVEIKPGVSPQTYELTLVASDGRAYDRTITADPSSSADDVVRLVAGNVGNLVAAIDSGSAVADREAVPIPAPALPVPVPTCPACPKLAPAVAPVGVKELPQAPPTLELGVGASPMTAIGLAAPDDADRFVGAGAGLALWMRHRTGALVGGEVRMLGRRLAFDTSLLRTRIGFSVGYAWRRGSFELATAASFAVEPWSVRADGKRSALGDPDGQARRRRPLLGGGASIIPAHRFRVGRVDVRLGPRLELSASSALGDGGRVAALLVDDAGRLRTVGRLGGWELGLGLDLVVWIPVR